MDNINIIETEYMGVVTQHIIIDRGNGEFTSMPKAIYDTLVSNSSTPQAGN